MLVVGSIKLQFTSVMYVLIDMAYIDDKYKNNPTVADRYYSETWKKRSSIVPIDGESLALYTTRLARVLRESEDTAHVHLKWHTGIKIPCIHQSAGECWICVQLQTIDIIYDILVSITELKKFGKLVFPIKHIG